MMTIIRIMMKTALFLMPLMVFIGTSPVRAQSKTALCHLAGAHYIAGLDVHGKKVVPADLNTGFEKSIDVVRIPITIDLAKQLNQTIPVGMKLDTSFGMIEIYQNSRVVFNGKEITGTVDTFCGKNLESVPVPVPVSVMPPVKETKEDIIWGEGY